MNELDSGHEAILGALSVKGAASSAELQAATGKSQPTVSRLLADLSTQVLTLGRARTTRYGLPKSIHGEPAQQPIWWIGEDGTPERLGQLSLLRGGSGGALHVEAAGLDGLGTSLPWFLTPLRAQGFLGRLLAQRLEKSGLGANPEGWPLEAQLYAALHLHDAPGAIVLGDGLEGASAHALLPEDPAEALDALALDVARTLPAGSSAGGEQPKFLTVSADGRHLLVKFTPPRGTPFGERWHDLLHAEALAAQVLAARGVAVAACKVLESAKRSYLLSERFDRIGSKGRRHVVSIGAVHEAFVPGAYRNWAASCEALARARRLGALAAAQAGAIRQFGHLIGNTDMHSGNLGLFVERADLARGRFSLAPVYDMLPMRWRPDPVMGGAPDYAPFEPDAASAASGARPPAQEFWTRLAEAAEVSRDLRRVAKEMARRLA